MAITDNDGQEMAEPPGNQPSRTPSTSQRPVENLISASLFSNNSPVQNPAPEEAAEPILANTTPERNLPPRTLFTDNPPLENPQLENLPTPSLQEDNQNVQTLNTGNIQQSTHDMTDTENVNASRQAPGSPPRNPNSQLGSIPLTPIHSNTFYGHNAKVVGTVLKQKHQHHHYHTHHHHHHYPNTDRLRPNTRSTTNAHAREREGERLAERRVQDENAEEIRPRTRSRSRRRLNRNYPH